MAKRPGIFPTFFLSGFECSTFLWGDGCRRDLVMETQHHEHALEDYRILQQLGIAIAREGMVSVRGKWRRSLRRRPRREPFAKPLGCL